MQEIPKALETSTVLDETGKPVPVSAILAEGPAVLVFLRHFG